MWSLATTLSLDHLTSYRTPAGTQPQAGRSRRRPETVDRGSESGPLSQDMEMGAEKEEVGVTSPATPTLHRTYTVYGNRPYRGEQRLSSTAGGRTGRRGTPPFGQEAPDGVKR